MTEKVLLGPFLTRGQAARRAGVVAATLCHRPDLLRINGRCLGECYFAFQFDQQGVRPDVGRVVRALHGRLEDVAIADWLVRPNHLLQESSPLGWMNGGGSIERVMEAARLAGPPRPVESPAEVRRPPEAPSVPTAAGTTGAAPRPRRRLLHARAAGSRPASSH